MINGSPYEPDKDDIRLALCSRRAREAESALAYVNMVGGQDELVFDGDSMVVDAQGETVARAAQFVEELLVVDLDLPAATPGMPEETEERDGLRVRRTVVSSDPVPAYDPLPSTVADRIADEAEVYEALVLGLRDYVRKNGFSSVLLGLSGGIDSTVVAAIAVDALGADNVYGVSMPSAYSSEHSKADAADLAKRTGLDYRIVPIAPMVDAFLSDLPLDGVAVENLQARVRGVILMALSNQEGHLVLTTGNKSELAVGYSTLYGDSVGGFTPIKDVLKTLVWRLARWRNADAERRGRDPADPGELDHQAAERGAVPRPARQRLPADVRGARRDPRRLRRGRLRAAELVQHGFDAELVDKVLRMVDRPSTSGASSRRARRSPGASAATAGCRSPTAGARWPGPEPAPAADPGPGPDVTGATGRVRPVRD